MKTTVLYSTITKTGEGAEGGKDESAQILVRSDEHRHDQEQQFEGKHTDDGEYLLSQYAEDILGTI